MNRLHLVVCLTIFSSPHLSGIVLASSKGLIDLYIDGRSFGVDGKMFGLMLKIRRELKCILHGATQEKGMYVFNQEHYTLKELMLLEKELLSNNNPPTLNALSDCLQVVKQDLDTHLTKYAELAKGVKQYILIFINESCEKHGRTSSILQNWAQVKDGQESDQLEKDIVDFQTAYQFCLDLIHFMEDMCDSCPKAREQFKQLIKAAKKS